MNRLTNSEKRIRKGDQMPRTTQYTFVTAPWKCVSCGAYGTEVYHNEDCPLKSTAETILETLILSYRRDHDYPFNNYGQKLEGTVIWSSRSCGSWITVTILELMVANERYNLKATCYASGAPVATIYLNRLANPEVLDSFLKAYIGRVAS